MSDAEQRVHDAMEAGGWNEDEAIRLLLAQVDELTSEVEHYQAVLANDWKGEALRLRRVVGWYQELDHDSVTAERGEELRVLIRSVLQS